MNSITESTYGMCPEAWEVIPPLEPIRRRVRMSSDAEVDALASEMEGIALTNGWTALAEENERLKVRVKELETILSKGRPYPREYVEGLEKDPSIAITKAADAHRGLKQMVEMMEAGNEHQ